MQVCKLCNLVRGGPAIGSNRLLWDIIGPVSVTDISGSVSPTTPASPQQPHRSSAPATQHPRVLAGESTKMNQSITRLQAPGQPNKPCNRGTWRFLTGRAITHRFHARRIRSRGSVARGAAGTDPRRCRDLDETLGPAVGARPAPASHRCGTPTPD